MKNIVFLAKSIDGFIAGINGELDWLNAVPNPENNDMGYTALMNEIDALVMGKNTFEMVCSFDGEWPYAKPVFVLSNSIKTLPDHLVDKVEIIKGDLTEVVSNLNTKGYSNLYIDGGKVVQSFLKEDLIDELRLTTLPIVLGNGIPLFDVLPNSLKFNHIKTEVFLNQIVQSSYERAK